MHIHLSVIRFRSDYEQYVRVWAQGFAQQEGKTKERPYQRITLRFGRTASHSRKEDQGEGMPGGARRRRRWRTAATADPVVGEWGVARMLRVMEEDKAE
jgi:hypothetical protein